MMETPQRVGLCRTMSWIVFRRYDMLTDNPDELRANMQRHKKRIRVKDPARELLTAIRDGSLPVMEIPLVAGAPPIDWTQVTEDDLWTYAKVQFNAMAKAQ